MIGRTGCMRMIFPARPMPVKPERLRHEDCEAEQTNQSRMRYHIWIMAQGLSLHHCRLCEPPQYCRRNYPRHHQASFGYEQDKQNQSEKNQRFDVHQVQSQEGESRACN